MLTSKSYYKKQIMNLIDTKITKRFLKSKKKMKGYSTNLWLKITNGNLTDLISQNTVDWVSSLSLEYNSKYKNQKTTRDQMKYM